MSRRPLALALALALPSAANATDLMQTFEMARSGDPQLASAESGRLAQKEGAVQARAALLPQITGSVGYDLEHNSRPGDPLGDGKSRSYGAKVSQTIFDWSRIANLRGQKALSQAADYDLASANNDLITRTSAAYFNVLIGIESLGDLSEEQFETYKSAIKDPVRVKRARHAGYENQRTIKAVAALKANDITEFGKLMNASHVSLRDDYEVTGIELDTLVEEAWKVDGVIGSRMTGAGFGGCTVSIVKDEAIEAFQEQVGKAYLEKNGYAADFYVVEIGDGPVVL